MIAPLSPHFIHVSIHTFWNINTHSYTRIYTLWNDSSEQMRLTTCFIYIVSKLGSSLNLKTSSLLRLLLETFPSVFLQFSVIFATSYQTEMNETKNLSVFMITAFCHSAFSPTDPADIIEVEQCLHWLSSVGCSRLANTPISFLHTGVSGSSHYSCHPSFFAFR